MKFAGMSARRSKLIKQTIIDNIGLLKCPCCGMSTEVVHTTQEVRVGCIGCEIYAVKQYDQRIPDFQKYSALYQSNRAAKRWAILASMESQAEEGIVLKGGGKPGKTGVDNP